MSSSHASHKTSHNEFLGKISKAEEIIAKAANDSGRNFFHCMGFMTYDRSLSFALDKRFMDTAARHQHLFDIQNWHWNLHVALWAAKSALSVPGDFVELGVYRGLTTGFVADYLDFGKIGKKWYLYDIFAALPRDLANDDWVTDIYDDIDQDSWYQSVVDRFKPYSNIEVIKGRVPDTLAQKSPERIAFMHVDMNSAKAEVAALEILFDRVSPGGIILLDDFGWTVAKQSQSEEISFFQKKSHMIMEIPTGQGLVIKR